MTELVLTDPIPSLFQELSAHRFETCQMSQATAVEFQSAVAIVSYGHSQIDGALLDKCPNVKVVSNHGVGVDHIEVAAARDRSVLVGNTPGCLDASTADMAMALILATARNVVVGDHFARSAEFRSYDPSLLIGQEVSGSTIGIVGLGRIGFQVAKRAAAFDMKVLYHNRNQRADIPPEMAVYSTLNNLLQQSDFVVLTCPLTTDTTGLIGQPQFDAMKQSAILINMARGPVVSTNDLFEAVRDGRIRAAGLDVTDPEPLPRDHPMLSLSNVVMTPHLGSASNWTRERMMQLTVDNLIAGVEGRPLPHPVP